ncbi:hypothetical protein TNCV_1348561 [Trichonephila clavipes]|nr:hypothetical protein TNCV_1348561 [Trichonephila clavipes]
MIFLCVRERRLSCSEKLQVNNQIDDCYDKILLWSPWKYRCGQRTVRLAVVACSQNQNTVFARRRIKVKAELKLKKQRLLRKNLELERSRKKNARGARAGVTF